MEVGLPRPQDRKGCHVFSPSTSRRHLFHPRLRPQLGSHSMAKLLRSGSPGRGTDRGVLDRGRRRTAGYGVAVDPLAGQLDLVRDRARRAAGSLVRIHRPEHRFGRTRPEDRRVHRLVQPADGDRHKHRQPPQRPAPGGGQLPRMGSAHAAEDPDTTRATVLMAIGVTIWHTPLFVMHQFGSSPIEALPTIAVTFWYAWLFNHASGSALLTLIAHAANGTIETSTLWEAGADTTRMTWLYSLVWCLVAICLLIFNRRFWTQPPAQVEDPDRVATSVGSA